MRLQSLLILFPVLFVAGCTGGTAPATNAAENTDTSADQIVDEDAATDSGPRPTGLGKEGVIAMAGGMAAMIEFCKLPGGTDRDQALATLKADASKHGLTPAEVERYFLGGFDAAKQKAESNPDKARKDCAQLEKMTDPAEVKKMEEAAKRMEEAVKKMEAQMKTTQG